MTWYRLLEHICTVDDVVKFAYKMGSSVEQQSLLSLCIQCCTFKGVGSNNAGFLVYQTGHIKHSIDKHGIDKEYRYCKFEDINSILNDVV